MPSSRVFCLLAASVTLAALGCATNPPPPVVPDAPLPASAAVATPATSTTPATPATPVPEPLREIAARFGLGMLGDGWSWKAIDRRQTRFDWSGTPATGKHEVLYSFWMERLDETTSKLVPQLVLSAAANLTSREPCPVFEQPADFARVLGVDRVLTVCFEPFPSMTERRRGVLHGIVQRGALSIVVVFADDFTGVVPLATHIGARGTP